ncbi:MAG: hypothetical protein ABI251_14615 [Mycobacteriaceae bacterium]
MSSPQVPPWSPQVSPPTQMPTGGTRIFAHIVGLFVGLFVTPVAIGLIAWASTRRLRRFQMNFDQLSDLTSLVLSLLGALLLLVLALLTVWAPPAPLVGGILLGVLPTVIQYVQPSWIYRAGQELPARLNRA